METPLSVKRILRRAMIWIFIFMAGLLITKFYTETAVRKLRSKAREKQKVLSEVRHSLVARQGSLGEVEKMEKEVKARLDRLQTLIVDVQIEINEAVLKARDGAPEKAEPEA